MVVMAPQQQQVRAPQQSVIVTPVSGTAVVPAQQPQQPQSAAVTVSALPVSRANQTVQLIPISTPGSTPNTSDNNPNKVYLANHPTAGQILVKKWSPPGSSPASPSPPVPHRSPIRSPTALSQHTPIPTTLSLPQEPVSASLLLNSSSSSSSASVFQKPLPVASSPSPVTVQRVISPISKPMVNTPLPKEIQLPSEPVPMSSKEIQDLSAGVNVNEDVLSNGSNDGDGERRLLVQVRL